MILFCSIKSVCPSWFRCGAEPFCAQLLSGESQGNCDGGGGGGGDDQNNNSGGCVMVVVVDVAVVVFVVVDDDDG